MIYEHVLTFRSTKGASFRALVAYKQDPWCRATFKAPGTLNRVMHSDMCVFTHLIRRLFTLKCETDFLTLSSSERNECEKRDVHVGKSRKVHVYR